MDAAFRIDPAIEADVPVILDLIRDLAEYEKLSDQVTATEADIARSLFGDPPRAEAVIARLDGDAIGFALFFHNYSTFLGRPVSIWRICTCARRSAGAASAAACSSTWPASPWTAAAAASSGRCSTGTRRPSPPIAARGALPLDDWTVYRLTGDALRRLASEA